MESGEVEGLLVAVDMNVPVDVAVGMGGGLLVAVMLGDSTAVADMDMAVADIAVPVADMGEGLLVVVAPVDMGEGLLVVVAPVDMAEMLHIVMPMVVVDMAVPVVVVVVPRVDMSVAVVLEPVDIDNPVGSGGFGMLASMLGNLLWHYHYTVTLVFRWWGVPVEYPHKLSPQ
ncbi:hypothetical protein NG798_25580 [Ancylothrix sp. C2]|uniref:hypothetical protein n=1 Tax=Ancylothrix sp. D3o TaxID=2953691 RepID=UPI0021BB3067|nr:hypothetical protein [Ancylothrix sp. D3o]MCT7953175.1 hypothetical protein [Ancylothrix sp. D3o]